MFDLSLEVQSGSVRGALKKYIAKEKLTGNNKYMCGRWVTPPKPEGTAGNVLLQDYCCTALHTSGAIVGGGSTLVITRLSRVCAQVREAL